MVYQWLHRSICPAWSPGQNPLNCNRTSLNFLRLVVAEKMIKRMEGLTMEMED